MSRQSKVGIYFGFGFPSIIRYIEPLTEDIFKTRLKDFHFSKIVFPPLGGEKLHEAQK